MKNLESIRAHLLQPFTVAALAVMPAFAADYYVAADGTGDYSQANPGPSPAAAAELAAKAGDVIHVGPGVYSSEDTVAVAAGVTMVGTTGHPDDVVLTRIVTGNNDRVICLGPNAALRDLTVRGGYTDYQAACVLGYSAASNVHKNFSVSNCVVENCSALYKGGGSYGGTWRNCIIRNCKIEHNRCCGMAPSNMRNFLFEENEICWSGEALVSCGCDCEDGWDQAQDAFFVRNWFHDNPQNDFVSCSGHNMNLIGNRGKISLYSRSYSPVVISNDSPSLRLGCLNRNRTGYWRYEGNKFDELFLGDSTSTLDSDWFSIVFDRKFVSSDPQKRPSVYGGSTGVFKNCQFEGVDASPGSAIDCTFRNCTVKSPRGTGGKWKNCTMENSKLLRQNCANVYQNCTFRNSFLNFAIWAKQTYDGCTFENVKFPKVSDHKKFTGSILPNCKYDAKCVFPEGWVKK